MSSKQELKEQWLARLHDYTAGLVARGFTNEAPPLAAEEDAAILADSSCNACGHHGLNFLPYRKGRTYIAIATCPACGGWFEF